METLEYKANASDVLDRLTAMYERRTPDRILASTAVPSPTLSRYRAENAEGFCDYVEPEARVRFWDALLAERRDLEDDSLPVAYLSEMDQGLYGGMVGGQIQYMNDPATGWISSMVPPLLDDLAEMPGLCADETGPAFERFLRQIDVFVQAGRGRFGVSHFILINGLNFVFELVGATRTYEALADAPDLVRRAVDFAFELNLKVQETYFERAWQIGGGTFSNMAQWLPGRIISESVDPFHMTSVEYFEEWGREAVERILARFDGGVMHVHGNGRHLLEAVASVRGLKALFLGDDTGFPTAFDALHEIRARTGDLPLVLAAPYEPFAHRLDQGDLPGGVFYLVSDVPGVDEANRLMEKVRAY